MKKSKLIMSVASLCFALAVLCFGVYAVQTVNYSLSGNITYEVTDAFVEINTKVYSSSTFMEQSELYNKIDEVLAGTYTGLTEESVNIPTYNSTDKDAIPEKDLDISFVGGEAPKLAFFVVVNIKNLSDTAVWANVNNPTLPNNVYQVNSGLESEITTNKNVVIALSLENQYKSVSSTVYTLGVQVGVDNNPISNFDFDSATKQISLKAGANPTDALVIPSYINQTRVTKVGSFAGANATSIYVPTSVEQMSRYCFADCKNLTELSLPFTGAKNYASEEEARNDLDRLEDDYPLEIYNYFGNDTYYEAKGLTVDNNLLYNFAADCGGYGYLPKSLITINLLYGCRAIDNAFYAETNENFFKEINLPNSLANIGIWAFYGCSSLTSITIPNSVTSIEGSAFQNCTGLTSMEIPSSVTSIGSNAFDSCTDLSSITIPNSITSMDVYAFNGCTGLTSVIIEDGATIIGDSAFFGCTGITSIIIPSSVTSIGNGAFSGCVGLENITVDAGNITYKSVDNCIIEISSKTLIAGCKNSVIPTDRSVTIIGSDAFYDCTVLTEIIIPSTVTSIESGAFNGCTGLSSIELPNSVTSIGNSAFVGCTGLTSITIPSSVESIGGGVFSNCTNLTSIEIPSSVTSIGNSAFHNCTGLTSITIPSSVISMGSDAFNSWTAKQTIKVPFANSTSKPDGWSDHWERFCNANIEYQAA